MLAHALALATLLSQPAPPPPPPTVSMSGTFVPAQPVGTDAFLFVLQVDAGDALHAARAIIRPRPGFEVPSPEQPIPDGARKATIIFEIHPTPDAPAAGSLIATVEAASAGAPLDQGNFTFTYVRRIGLASFYLLALLGVLAGWFVKQGVKAHADSKPPAVVRNLFLSPTRRARNAVALRSGETPEKSALAARLESSALLYYVVDAVLTVGIGFLVLVALTRDGAAPSTGSSWQGALITGFALGLLAPQDLLGKVA